MTNLIKYLTVASLLISFVLPTAHVEAQVISSMPTAPPCDVVIKRAGNVIIPFYPTANTDAARGVALQNANLAARISGFNTGNLNMDATLTTTANTGNTSSPVVSSSNYTFQAWDVNNFVYIQGGTAGQGWIPNWYQIASVAGGAATLYGACSSVATPTGGVWSMDYSQASSPVFNWTNLTVDATTNTIVTGTDTNHSAVFDVNMNGNTLIVTGGTSWTPARYEVNTVAHATNKATLWNLTQNGSPAATTTSGGTATLGGPCNGDQIILGPGRFQLVNPIVNNSSYSQQGIILGNGIDLIGASKNTTEVYTNAANMEMCYSSGTNEIRGVFLHSYKGSAEPLLTQSNTALEGASRLLLRDSKTLSDTTSGTAAGGCLWQNGSGKQTLVLYNSDLNGFVHDAGGAQYNVVGCRHFCTGSACVQMAAAGSIYNAFDSTYESTGISNENTFLISASATANLTNCKLTLDSGTGACFAQTNFVNKPLTLVGCTLTEPSTGVGVLSSASSTGSITVSGGIIGGGGTDLKRTSSGTTNGLLIVSPGTLFTAGSTSGYVKFVGPGHTNGLTAAPTMAGGTGAGSGGSLSIPANTTGTDQDGIISITTGGTAATSSPIVTVTFASQYPLAPYVTLTPGNAAAAALADASQPYITTTATTFVINSNATKVADNTAYIWYYHVGG